MTAIAKIFDTNKIALFKRKKCLNNQKIKYLLYYSFFK